MIWRQEISDRIQWIKWTDYWSFCWCKTFCRQASRNNSSALSLLYTWMRFFLFLSNLLTVSFLSSYKCRFPLDLLHMIWFIGLFYLWAFSENSFFLAGFRCSFLFYSGPSLSTLLITSLRFGGRKYCSLNFLCSPILYSSELGLIHSFYLLFYFTSADWYECLDGPKLVFYDTASSHYLYKYLKGFKLLFFFSFKFWLNLPSFLFALIYRF